MNEHAETKLSTIRPTTERERRARSAARAEFLALVLNAAATAGRIIEVGGRSNGGGAIDAIRSARRDMATLAGALSAGRRAAAKLSVMTPLHRYFSAP